MAQVIHIPKGSEYREKLANNVRFQVASLDAGKAWEVVIRERKSQRTIDQNSLLWSIYSEIIKRGGEAMQGYDKDDLHEVFLGIHFGEETREVLGKVRTVPLRRSSGLSKHEFSEFVDHIIRFMAERGVVIQSPNEETPW